MNKIFYDKLIVTTLAILIVYVLSTLIMKILVKKEEGVKTKHLTRKWIGYTRTVIIVFIIMLVWLQDVFSVTTILGFTSAGLALSLNQVILNIAGWMLFMIKRPIEIGDRIEYKDIKGDVIDIRMFYIVVLEVGNWVKLDQSTGRLATIPTGKIFTDPFFNFTSGFNAVWDEIDVLITFDSDKDRAKEIIIDIANKSMDKTIFTKIRDEQKEMSKKFAVKSGKLTPITYFSIKESGIQIELRYLSFVRKRRDTNNFINEKIYEAFMKEENINFAYPSQKIYLEK
ncbi:mechanosensitive ion channel family protein [Helicovermis profundi]|uniref:Mechanosensitive ion channel MscS domain-containing protein n=1 Tax=Helicovermis profundi TaxID=3065157 RepID=A0AAU9ESY3_9FIRM|nr:hypothetical protein HLPR_18910 [Clostridia bacterium S502]